MIGSVDHLLCFAGVVGCQHALEMTAGEWRKTLDINTTGGFLCAQAAAKQMVRQGRGGSIIFVASISGHRVNFPQPQVKTSRTINPSCGNIQQLALGTCNQVAMPSCFGTLYPLKCLKGTC